MPFVTLKLADEIFSEHTLDKKKSLCIGRDRSNNIILNSVGISLFHAKIDTVGDNFLFSDLKSKNGSRVNGKAVKNHFLKHGDIIIIGTHTLFFEFDDWEKTIEPDENSLEQTMIIDPDKKKSLFKNVSISKVPTIATLSFLSLKQKSKLLKKKITVFGKNPDSDVVVKGFFVGKIAAVISQRPNAYYLSYLNGFIKPKVNGIKIKKHIKLKEFDIIEIGSLKMQLIIKEIL